VSTIKGALRSHLTRDIGETKISLETFRPILAEQEANEATKTTAMLKAFIQEVAETEIAEEERRDAVLALHFAHSQVD